MFRIINIILYLKIMMRLFENPGQMWKSTGFAYRFFLISTSIVFVFSLVNPNIFLWLFDQAHFTILKLQLWRLFFGCWITYPSLFSLLNILFSFLWMLKFFEDQKKKSSVYMFWEILIISFQIHVLFNILAIVPILFIQTGYIMAFGWFPIILVYEFRQSQVNPQGTTRFCCLPCLIKKKTFPYVLILIFCILGSSRLLGILAAGMIGYIQQVKLQSNIIKLPFKFYVGFQKILPKCIKNHSTFTPISQVQSTLRLYSCGGGARNSEDNSSTSTFANPFRSGQNSQKKEENKVVGGGQGVIVDSSSKQQVGFKNYWAFKEQSAPKEENKEQYEIEPEFPNSYSKQKNEYEGYNKFVDSSLNQDTSQNKYGDKKTDQQKSEIELEKKVQKQNSDELI